MSAETQASRIELPPPPRPGRQVKVTVSPEVYQGLQSLARDRGQKVATVAGDLLLAAFKALGKGSEPR